MRNESGSDDLVGVSSDIGTDAVVSFDTIHISALAASELPVNISEDLDIERVADQSEHATLEVGIILNLLCEVIDERLELFSPSLRRTSETSSRSAIEFLDEFLGSTEFASISLVRRSVS